MACFRIKPSYSFKTSEELKQLRIGHAFEDCSNEDTHSIVCTLQST